MSSSFSGVENDAVFVMGLPRSGSTLLSRILNESEDILSVNDLYFLQGVQALGVENELLSTAQASQLIDRLLSVIDTRANANEEFIGQFQISPNRIDEIRSQAMARQIEKPFAWDELMDYLLADVARSAGKKYWADKTPQNFYHFEILSKRFPKAKFIFLFRDPRDILASYKYAKGEGHDSRRYHPLVYSLYWRSAVRYYKQVASHPRVMMLKYEDILVDIAGACNGLGGFLGTSIPAANLASLGHNSSFTGQKRKGITDTETRICQYICRNEMAALGYAEKDAHIHLSEVFEVLTVSVKFAVFQIARFFRDRDARKRIGNFVGGLARK